MKSETPRVWQNVVAVDDSDDDDDGDGSGPGHQGQFSNCSSSCFFVFLPITVKVVINEKKKIPMLYFLKFCLDSSF